ncbi:hypothetical protein BH20ACI1_BH20ACI1_00550 [soil metagenome]
MEEKFSDCPTILERLTEKRFGSQVAAAPKISVIIPAYNIAPYIKETLDSVFAQTYKDFEIVLVNDGSTDTEELEKVLAPYFDKIIYAEQTHLGASQTRNAAICLAQCEFLAFLDGDDIWFPGFLESSINYLEKNSLEMVYCDAELFGERLFSGKTFMQTAPSNGKVTAISLINCECNVITSGTVIKKDLIVKFNMFDTDFTQRQDFDLWFRLAKNGAKIGYQKKVLLKYRVRLSSLSGTNIDRAERNIRALDVVNKYELNEQEKAVWEKQMALCEAQLELEKGKSCLISGDFPKARTHIAQANKFYRKSKLSLIIGLINFSPQLALRLFRKIRPSEVAFILPNNEQK